MVPGRRNGRDADRAIEIEILEGVWQSRRSERRMGRSAFPWCLALSFSLATAESHAGSNKLVKGSRVRSLTTLI